MSCLFFLLVLSLTIVTRRSEGSISRLHLEPLALTTSLKAFAHAVHLILTARVMTSAFILDGN